MAVGLTPEMLPMIVSVCLSRGAIAMSRKKVIVKRLNSIQNLGAMDVLCTDKTGTLTLDRVILERHCDVVRHEDEGVLVLAYLNSHFQTGLRNVLDRAILQFEEIHEKFAVPDYKKIDEIPFDFSRKLMSVVVETPEGIRRLICKGATEAVFQCCDRFELEGKVYPVDPLLITELKEYCDELSADGFRVLAIAYKDVPAAGGLFQGRRAATWCSRATWPSSIRPRIPRPPPSWRSRTTASRSKSSPATTNWSAARSARKSGCRRIACCWAGRWKPCRTPNWPRRPNRPRSSPGSRRPTSSG